MKSHLGQSWDVVDKFWYAVRLNKFYRLNQSEHVETGIEIVEKKSKKKKK